MTVQRVLILTLLSCVLAACGGGGGGGAQGGGTGTNQPPTTTPPGGDPPTNPPPSSGPPSEEQSSAQNAKLRITQDADVLMIDWQDLFDNERGYRLERRVENGEWREIGTTSAGDGERMLWMPVIPASGTYRLVAMLDDHSVPLHAALNETEFAIELGPSPITITIDQTEPVRGSVQVGLQNAGAVLSVSYQLDHAQVAESTSGGAFSATVPASRLVNGQHVLSALVQKTEGLWMYIERPVQIDNPDPALLLHLNVPSIDASAPVTMSARATSRAGIVSVAFFLNDAPLGVVTTPNAASQYAVSVHRTTVPSGAIVVRAVATDYNGATVSMEQRFTMNHFPQMSVTGLIDGLVVTNGRLDVRVDYGDDAPGATVTILVGEQRIVQTQTNPLIGSYSLAGLAPGDYPVLVRVRDVTGKVAVGNFRLTVSSTGLNYELIAIDAGELLATDAGSLLYRKDFGPVVLRTATGTETRLPGTSPDMRRYWLVEDRIVAYGSDRRVFVLDANGLPVDLSGPNDFRAANEPIVRGPWLAWGQSGTFRLYNVRTGEVRNVQLGSSLISMRGYDFDPTPGHERLLLSANMNGVVGIYSHNLATSTTQLLVSGNAFNLQTDGTRMSWVNGSEFNASLMVASIDNPAASTALDTGIIISQLKDGLVCWQDRESMLHVNDGSISTRLTEFGLWDEETLRDGHIIFRDESDMRVWTAAGGERVWLDSVARETIQADGVAYFLTGERGRTLYRVTLP